MVKEGDYNHVLIMLTKNKYLIHDFDEVNIIRRCFKHLYIGQVKEGIVE